MDLQQSIINDLEAIKALPKVPFTTKMMINTLLNPLKKKKGEQAKLVALRELVDNMKKGLEKDGYKIA
jgi:hypothetical protein